MEFTRVLVDSQGRIEMFPVISPFTSVQEAYEAMRRDGQSHNIAEMLALQQSPAIQTDATFLAGHCNGNQFEKTPIVGDFYRTEAERAGVNTKGKVYKSSLAEYAGDPKAWVSGRSDIVKVAEERGWGVKGSVNVKLDNTRKPMDDIDVAPDLVHERVFHRAAANPDVMRRPYRDVFEETKEQMLPAKDTTAPVDFETAFKAAMADAA